MKLRTAAAALTIASLSVLSLPAQDREREWEMERDRRFSRVGDMRDLVSRTIYDLQHSYDMAVTGRMRDRLQNAQRHLSEFDRRMAERRFDEPKLNVAIDDINNVLKGNDLTPRERDRLSDDIAKLREMRRMRDERRR